MLQTGTGFAIACIIDAECEKTLIGRFPRWSSDDVLRFTRIYVVKFDIGYSLWEAAEQRVSMTSHQMLAVEPERPIPYSNKAT